MGSPVSPIVANLFMENFEVKAINTAQYPPKMWKRYVDDTCVIMDSARKEDSFNHISSLDPHIHFTSEDAKPDRSIPFLDTIVMPQSDGSLKTTVYRKSTPYRHVLTLGQLPSPVCKIQCHQHPQTQSKNSMFKQSIITRRRRPPE